jgi:hypothetical protein
MPSRDLTVADVFITGLSAARLRIDQLVIEKAGDAAMNLASALTFMGICGLKFLRGAGCLNLARTRCDGRSCRHYS